MTNKPEQWPAPPTPDQWNEMVEAHQRWWTEWLEAGQLWMSWWYSTLPPMPWPPAGVVLPATDVPATPLDEARPPAAATPPAPAPKVNSPQRKPRAASARHH
ncbi:MAG: hypothetical protein RJA44_294 [Pseudomonadota bacterium]|jgi:hypothetical protein